MAKRPVTPLGLTRYFFPAYYLLVLWLTGYPSAAVEPLKALFAERGLGGDMTPKEQENHWIELTTQGVTLSIMSSVLVGIFNDCVGPKITAVLGQLILTVAYGLIFLTDVTAHKLHSLGCCLQGLSFFAIFLPHTGVATLFPSNTTLVLAIVGAGPDLSCSTPTFILWVAQKVGIRGAILGYMALMLGIAFLEAFLVPWRSFEEDDGVPQLVSGEVDEIAGSDAEGGLLRDAPRGFVKVHYSELSLAGQLLTPHFWALLVFTCVNMFRKTQFLQLVRPMFETVAEISGHPVETATRFVNLYTMTMWTSVFPSIGMGFVTNTVGVEWGTAVQNMFAVLFYLFVSLPVMALQYLSILFYLIMAGYIFGVVYAALATYYGFRTLGTLQGIQMLAAGIINYLFPYWNRHVVDSLPNVLVSNWIIFGVSVAMFIVPVIFYLKKPYCLVPVDKAGENQALVPAAPRASEDARRRASRAFSNAPGLYDSSAIKAVSNAADATVTRRK